MDPSPFVRTSFWTLTVGMTTAWVAKLGVSQCCIQRFLAVPNIEVAKKSVWIFAFGLGALKLGAILLGLIIYAKYENCDPVLSKQISKRDQIVPLFVMDVASRFPGLPGLFIGELFLSLVCYFDIHHLIFTFTRRIPLQPESSPQLCLRYHPFSTRKLE